MTVNVIVSFNVREEKLSGFRGLMAQVKVSLPQTIGCRGVRIFTNAADPLRFTLLETWESEELHKAHIDNVIASGGWTHIASHLSSDPVSGYFQES